MQPAHSVEDGGHDLAELVPLHRPGNDGHDLAARFDALKTSLREDPDGTRTKIAELRSAVAPPLPADHAERRPRDAGRERTPTASPDGPARSESARQGPPVADRTRPMARALVGLLLALAMGAAGFAVGRRITAVPASATEQGAIGFDAAEPARPSLPSATAGPQAAAQEGPTQIAVDAVPADAVPADAGPADAESADAEPVDAGAVVAAAGAALTAAGHPDLTIGFESGILDLEGVVSPSDLSDGYFAHVAAVEAVVSDIRGVDHVESRLQLRGDEALLRSRLREISAGGALGFATGSSDLTAAATAALTEAASHIIANPGLRILVAGHTDTRGDAEANAVLAADRAEAVVARLASLGVPITRLQVVAYGELFDDPTASDAESRRVDFEVAP